MIKDFYTYTVYKKIPVLIHNGRPIYEFMIIVTYPICESMIIVDYIDEVGTEGLLSSLPTPPTRRTQGGRNRTCVRLVPTVRRGIKSFSAATTSATQTSQWGRKMVGFKLLNEAKTPSLVGWAQRFCSSHAVRDLMPAMDKLQEYNGVIEAM
ncbi:glutathione S-transferase [Musa troglodytarum]|uniref:Glutathione S-transferase n=1 Tax=Musa troglodytarum TaxID=320322 RepID=A0A9E7FJW3_9LILI|nr:glutathione S-transferase [Musa troglodytarum]URD98296.1 glutathione S-transferase [Musa troglodytarum]